MLIKAIMGVSCITVTDKADPLGMNMLLFKKNIYKTKADLPEEYSFSWLRKILNNNIFLKEVAIHSWDKHELSLFPYISIKVKLYMHAILSTLDD